MRQVPARYGGVMRSEVPGNSTVSQLSGATEISANCSSPQPSSKHEPSSGSGMTIYSVALISNNADYGLLSCPNRLYDQ